MNVVVVAYDLARDNVGGVQNRMYRLVCGLQQRKDIGVLAIFNLYNLTKFQVYSKKPIIEVFNIKDITDFYNKISQYLNKNDVDLLYCCDYRRVLNLKFTKKTRPGIVIASVPDIDLLRSKYMPQCIKKISLEKYAFNHLDKKHLDFFHVSCSAHELIVKKYIKHRDISFVVSPVGLPLDEFTLKSKSNYDSGIVACRSDFKKNINHLSKIIYSNQILKKIYLFTNGSIDLDFDCVEKRVTTKYEEIIPYYKKSIINFDLMHTHTFANGLVEGAFYGCIPVINATNFVSYDLFDGNIIFDTEYTIINEDNVYNYAKMVFKFARKQFNLTKNINNIIEGCLYG